MSNNKPTSFSFERFTDHVLHRANGTPPFVVQIGTMDGVRSGDKVHPLVMRHGWNALLVEPLPEHMALAKGNYHGAEDRTTFAQVAINTYNGDGTMLRVRPELITDDIGWAAGSSHLKDAGTRLDAFHIHDLAKDMIEVPVTCQTLPTLLSQHSVSKIDALQIDAEGWDWQILKQLDTRKYKPSIIRFEYTLLQPNEAREAKHWLAENGYAFVLTNGWKDMLAVRKDLLQEMNFSELGEYNKYLTKGDVKNPGDLAYAVALLGSAASCFTGNKYISGAVNDPSSYCLDMRGSTKTQREPNFPEALDAINRMSPLFTSRSAFHEFITEQMPKMALNRVPSTVWER